MRWFFPLLLSYFIFLLDFIRGSGDLQYAATYAFRSPFSAADRCESFELEGCVAPRHFP